MESTRRQFLALGVAGAGGAALGSRVLDGLFSASEGGPPRGRGYGRLGPPDENGVRLPPGFRSRLVARGGQTVPGTGYKWHLASDGAATFPDRAGGWVLVSNSEVYEGGASAIRFGPDGRPTEAYRVLDGTTQNCSGGATPWNTWLSCEEVEGGYVWECDPYGRRRAIRHPAMGVFKHEAAAVDKRGRQIYLTEDLKDGGLYRFSPRRWPSLRDGSLEVALVSEGGGVRWKPVPDPSARTRSLRDQVPGSTRFKRAEGLVLHDGVIYLTTTADHRVHAYDIAAERIDVAYDGLASPSAPILRPDQLAISPRGEVLVCEDLATSEIDLGLFDRSGRMSRFLSVTGPEHRDSELTGVTFDPSGRRMYFASQRARRSGAIYEVTGPFGTA